MNRRLMGSLILGSTFVFAAVIAKAQQAPPSPSSRAINPGGAEGEVMPFAFGERMELLGFGGIHGGKVVAGAPLSAVAVTETTQTLADGNHIARKTVSNLYRDSQGRVRREVTLSGSDPLAASGKAKSFAVISDPVAGTTFMLRHDLKTAEQVTKPFGRMGGMNRSAGGAGKEGMMARQQQEIASGLLKKEDLGTQTIGGVAAQGTRLTKTIPARQIGNEKPITIVREFWYSNELQTVVMSKHSDPWSGETTYTLNSIQRAEPDAALFTVPADYTVTQGHTHVPGRMRQNRALPPAGN
jgi:hypothetical protein